MARNSTSAPEFVKFLGPVVLALRELGGSGRPEEVRTAVAKALSISEEDQARQLPSGVQTRFENQVHWARFYLAKAGIIDSSRSGVWTLTERGRSLAPMSMADAREIFREVAAGFARSRKPSDEPSTEGTELPGSGESLAEPESVFVGYREAVAAKLQTLPASGFERFCQRLLRESGFEEVTV
jgi:restriction system protein